MRDFDDVVVSVTLLYGESLPYGLPDFQVGLRAALAQDHPRVEVIVVDGRGPDAAPDFLPVDATVDSIRHLPGKYANRAAMLNAALRDATGEFLLLLFNEQENVVLKKSAVRTMVMAACRSDEDRRPRGADVTAGAGPGRYIGRLPEIDATSVSMVYGDYERVEADGSCKEVHLLDWHEGRLRDTVDFGAAIMFRADALRDLGGFDARFAAADLYDMRLRVS